jgi:amidase
VKDLLDLGACALTAKIAARELSCEELLRATLARIEALNPRFNPIVALRDSDALIAEARVKDAGPPTGALYGLPMAVKELEAVAGLPLNKGSPALVGHVSTADSPMVARLRAAGAILIGKTNVPEFALGSHTVNPVYGPTRNAYDERLSAGGSSGGAAVALAVRMVALADGSDYGGSLRNPAGWNNVYGFRPSFGRVPRDDSDAWIPSMSVLGPMARDADDLGLLFSVQAGYDAREPLSLEGDGAAFRGPFTADMKGKRVAWVGDFGGAIPFDPGVMDVARGALKAFADMGCVVEEARPDFDVGEVWRAFKTLRQWQYAALLDLYNDPARRALLPPSAIYEVENGLRLGAYEISAAAAVRTRWTHAVRRFFERFDFWALPTAQCFAFPIETKWPTKIGGQAMESYHEWMQCVVPATMCGSPTLAAPAGFDAQGRAMGVQIVAPNHGERELLEFAGAYHRVTGWPERRRPEALG